MSKYIISVCTNSVTHQIEVAENVYFKTLGSSVYEVNDDYDFGSIDPKDVAVQMYKDDINKHPGISRLLKV